MTVADLIRKLHSFNHEAPVYVTTIDEWGHNKFYAYVTEVTIDEDGEIGIGT